MPAGNKPSAPSCADELAEIILPDHECHDVRLGDLWSEHPMALVWLRHYGCILCKEHAIQLDRARGEFKAAGARLVLIGQATPRHAAQFRRQQGIQLPVLADEERISYRAAGAKIANMTELFGPRSVTKGILAGARTRRIQTRTVGNSAQLGGSLVVAPGGAIAWSHMSADAGDNASPEEILAAVRTVVA
ncbi:MAG TPA: peroxiredoxin-like family protein [Solirubrobacteraceae bacterium]|nr:peroxiredoxin-like family protein [Solirubrobacteraceae bacterium]